MAGVSFNRIGLQGAVCAFGSMTLAFRQEMSFFSSCLGIRVS